LKLSEKRAKAVYDYLLVQQIPVSQISYKGYGNAMPIADNDTDEGRSQNRRTEMKVLAFE